MPDLVVTASQVINGGGSELSAIASVAIAAGELVYKLAADGRLALADNNVTIVEANAVGVATGTAAVGQTCPYVTRGKVTMGAGAAPVSGQVYCVSINAGKIAVESDVAPAAWMKPVGVGSGSNQIDFNFDIAPVQHA